MKRLIPKTIRRFIVAAAAVSVLAAGSAEAAALRIGITLHPYYSFVASIVGDRAEIIPLIDADANPHGYAPQPGDMIRITSMDVLVVNGIGHDSWAFEILDRSRFGRTRSGQCGLLSR
jgi:zinc transport system substrate-binding protein